MRFDLDSPTRRRLGQQLVDTIDQYFSALGDRPVQLPAEQRSYAPLAGALPETAEDPERVFAQACRQMVEQGFHVTSGNYYGLMNPTPTYMGVLGEALVAALNPQIATLARSQLASRTEQQTVRWICERLYPQLVRKEDQDYLLHPPFDGTFTSGGNEANFSGLALALAWKFPRIVEEGVGAAGGRPLLYASAEAITLSTSRRGCWASGAARCAVFRWMSAFTCASICWSAQSKRTRAPGTSRSAW